MHYTFEKPICSCGSTKCFQECQVFSIEEKWTTRRERLLDPTFVKATCYPCVSVYDPEWFTCDICGKDADLALVKAELAKIDWSKVMFKEEIGICLINPRGVKTL